MPVLARFSPDLERLPWAPAVSISAHLLLLALTLLVSQARPFEPPAAPPSISVELVPAPVAPVVQAVAAPTPAPPSPLATSGPSSPATPVIPPPAARPAPVTRSDGFTHATTFFAAGMLSGPAGRKLARNLSHFADSEKINQLCNMEGTEQVRHADPPLNPDVIVAYAFGDTDLEGLTLLADHGAIHSGKAWYALRFRCTVQPDYQGVSDFAFVLGDLIPRAQWASHGLPEQYQDSE